MVPSRLYRIEKMPLTATNKIDRVKLKEWAASSVPMKDVSSTAPASGSAPTAQITEMPAAKTDSKPVVPGSEAYVASVCSKVLGREADPGQTFFAQGGTSPVQHSLLYSATEGTVDVGTKLLSVILPTTDTMEADYTAERANGRDINTLRIIGYQKALADDDKRVRLVFGIDTDLEALDHYGFEMTLSYANAAGGTVVKHADVDSYLVYTTINGKDKDGNDTHYTAGVDYTCKYFATLVVNPTVNGAPISGGATVTVTAYTIDCNGYRRAYGAEAVTLVFDTDGNMTDPSANVK
jgi:hypothetical protein